MTDRPSGDDATNPGRSDAQAALIVTLEMDAETFARLDGLRRLHFPQALNHIPAHLTLFHKLPGERLDDVAASLRDLAPAGPIAMEITGVRLLGRGVAYDFVSPEAAAFHRRVARRWAAVLTPQDQQAFKAHVTIQNKTSPQAARALRDEIAREFNPRPALGVGVRVWRYLGGPWRLEREIAFGAE